MARVSDQLVDRLVTQIVTLAEENARLKTEQMKPQLDALRAERDWMQEQYKQLHEAYAQRQAGR